MVIASQKGSARGTQGHPVGFPWFAICLLALFSLGAGTALGKEITLAWNENTDPDLVGYRVHYGSESGDYDKIVDVGLQTEYVFSTQSGEEYYFAVTAYDVEGYQSGFSDEVSWDGAPPDIGNVKYTVTHNSVVISWTTNEEATSSIDYGLDPDANDFSEQDEDLTSSHQIVLTGLSQATTYYLQISGEDDAGNEAGSTVLQLTTKTLGDVLPPVISSVSLKALSKSSIAVLWKTDESATSEVRFGQKISYGSTAKKAGFSKSHEVVLKNIAMVRPYHFKIVSQDKAGNKSVSADRMFVLYTKNNKNLFVKFLK